MSALKRVWRAAWMVAGLWVGSLAIATLFGGAVRGAVSQAMGQFAWVDDGHLLVAFGELMATQRGVTPAITHNIIATALIGLLFWTLAAGAIITRLDSRRPAGELAAASISNLGGIVTQTLWIGAFVRLVPMGIAGALYSTAPVPAMILGVLFTAIAVVTGDFARTSVVLHDARPYHPKTALRALRSAFRNPGAFGMAQILAIAQAAIPVLFMHVVVTGSMGGGGIWLARGLSLLGIILGLWRIATVIEATDDGADA